MHICPSLICCSESLDEIIATIYALILLLFFGCVCSRQHFDKVLEIGVAKVAAFVFSISYKAHLHRFYSRNAISRRIRLVFFSWGFNYTMNGALNRVVAPSCQQISGIDDDGILDRSCVDEISIWTFDL